jgi:hypothetical protein
VPTVTVTQISGNHSFNTLVLSATIIDRSRHWIVTVSSAFPICQKKYFETVTKWSMTIEVSRRSFAL